MSLIKSILFLLIIGLPFHISASDDHFSVYLTKEGIEKALLEVIKGYNSNAEVTTFTIPADKVESKILKRDIDSNPIISSLRDYALFDLNEDLKFYTKWSPIYLNLKIKDKSLNAKFVQINGTQTQFQVNFKLDQATISGKSIEICEIRKNVKKCDSENSLYSRFEDYKISLNKGQSIDVAVVFDIFIKNSRASLRLNQVYTNLFSPSTKALKDLYGRNGLGVIPPTLNVNFKNFIMPAPVLTIDGQSYKIEITKIKDVILSEKAFLSKTLVEFAGSFISKDISGIINSAFLNNLTNLNTTLVNIRKKDSRENPYSYQDPSLMVRDNTRVETNYRPIQIKPNMSLVEEEVTFFKEIKNLLNEVYYKADFNLSISSLKSKREGDLLINSKSSLSLNNIKMTISRNLKNNSSLYLKNSDIELLRDRGAKFDFALSLSEPLLNGFLSLGSSSKLFDKALTKFNNIPGVYLNGVKMYFEPPMSIVAVADIEIKLSSLTTKGVGGWIKNKIGSLIEGDNIYFPLEIKLTPVLERNLNATKIKFIAESPLGYKGLKNSYKHPYKKMHASVESSVIDTLKEEFIPLLDSGFDLDLTPYLSYKGLGMRPLSIFVRDTGHLVVTGLIDKLSIKELME